jgi:hypothetical protein
MSARIIRTLALGISMLACAFGAALLVQAQAAEAPYPKMAPLDQYLMSRDAEIALARSAAPKSISDDAEVLVLGRHGYETAVQGKNGFVCMVDRSWTNPVDNPNFWNPKLRGAMCLNRAAAQFYIPIAIKKTELILAGKSKEQMADGIKAAFDKKELPSLQPGAMCYMMSKQQYLDDVAGHWHPHLMFFIPETAPVTWGENLPGSPVLSSDFPLDRFTIQMILVAKWSDGTRDSPVGR